jgi:putative endonuclease
MNSPKTPAVYILASKRNGTLYTGATSDLVKRIWQHRNSVVDGFTQKYSVHRLVYYELADDDGCHRAGKTDQGWLKG